MDRQAAHKEFRRIEKFLMDEKRWMPLSLDGSFINSLEKEAGVYMLFKGRTLVYVGETGSIRGRVSDMRNTMNHTIRRSIGHDKFRNEDNYWKASSTVKYHCDIERMINDYMHGLHICVCPVHIGRKEFEEYIFEIRGKPAFNRKVQRGKGKREKGRGKREKGKGKREKGKGKREEGRGKREEGRGKGRRA